MSSSGGFRFSIAQVMGVIAVSAVFFAATSYSLAGQYMYLVAISYITSLAGALVLLYNVRLSGWMWFAFAGFAAPLLTSILLNLASSMSPSFNGTGGHYILTLHLAMNSVFSILFVLGLGMTLRDVRRRLAGGGSSGQGEGAAQAEE